ncbi:MAG TPA: DUF6515 family protein [Steroidobacteraceae bacterium]|nr:DUF6515 family protein [Steroidobacteraceae bacterium]
MKRGLLVSSVLVASLALGAGLAQAEPHGHGPRPGDDRLDARFNHNHYYPARGYIVRDLPRERVIVERGHDRFFYSSGVWYAPRGPGFVVVGPPVGVFVPVLPAFYTTVWFGGMPYYYANDTYYLWRDSSQEYEVVDPPGAEQAASTQAPATDEVFVYPKNGQSPDLQARDQYECHKWASGETGFDPTQAGGGVPPDQTATKRAAYQRAMGACLEGRGYSVK